MRNDLNVGIVREVVVTVNMIVRSSLLEEIIMELMAASTSPRIMFGLTHLQRVRKTSMSLLCMIIVDHILILQ